MAFSEAQLASRPCFPQMLAEPDRAREQKAVSKAAHRATHKDEIAAYQKAHKAEIAAWSEAGPA